MLFQSLMLFGVFYFHLTTEHVLESRYLFCLIPFVFPWTAIGSLVALDRFRDFLHERGRTHLYPKLVTATFLLVLCGAVVHATPRNDVEKKPSSAKWGSTFVPTMDSARKWSLPNPSNAWPTTPMPGFHMLPRQVSEIGPWLEENPMDFIVLGGKELPLYARLIPQLDAHPAMNASSPKTAASAATSSTAPAHWANFQRPKRSRITPIDPRAYRQIVSLFGMVQPEKRERSDNAGGSGEDLCAVSASRSNPETPGSLATRTHRMLATPHPCHSLDLRRSLDLPRFSLRVNLFPRQLRELVFRQPSPMLLNLQGRAAEPRRMQRLIPGIHAPQAHHHRKTDSRPAPDVDIHVSISLLKFLPFHRLLLSEG